MIITEEAIMINKSELIEVLRSLEEIVVSLDRIGSCEREIGRQQYERLLIEYIENWDVTNKLSSMRAKLSEPFPRTLGSDQMDDLERALQDVQHWSLDNPLLFVSVARVG